MKTNDLKKAMLHIRVSEYYGQQLKAEEIQNTSINRQLNCILNQRGFYF